MIDALCREIELRNNFLAGQKVSTLYFGGGTPSLLDRHELERIILTVAKNFDLIQEAEITLEANPDDLTPAKLSALMDAGINRLSIGIQSFNDKYLEFFNRAHDSKMAIDCVENARRANFDNISLDLIYGIPGQTVEELKTDLKKMIWLQSEHISIYGLTIEKGTAFGRWLEKDKLKPLDEHIAAEQLEYLMSELDRCGYLQYEISNFSKPGFESRHNYSYWQDTHYLGIGPSAHSFDGQSRQVNVGNNNQYITAILAGRIPAEIENLSESDKINEYILTRIRTSSGIDLEEFTTLFESDFYQGRSSVIQRFIQQAKITIEDNRLRLTKSGKLLADYITEKLFV